MDIVHCPGYFCFFKIRFKHDDDVICINYKNARGIFQKYIDIYNQYCLVTIITKGHYYEGENIKINVKDIIKHH